MPSAHTQSILRFVELLSLIFFSGLLSSLTQAAALFPEFIDPHPNSGNQFGYAVVPLSTGNVVITAPWDDAGGTDAGAVYLFNGATGDLISTIIGYSTDDRIGSSGVTPLSNGNFVISSPTWNNGAIDNAGAVTWGSGSSGVSGVVSPANSLVGSNTGDVVGDSGIIALNNGNYVVSSQAWKNGTIVGAGAATWGNGSTGISGVVSAANSLVGTKAHDNISYGGNITALSNGNYVVSSYLWDNGSAVDAGAVTWGSGTSGVSGVVTAANSLIGSKAEDKVGRAGVTALTNGNYVVKSIVWDNGTINQAGAVTWASGTIGISGFITAANSLVGSTENDFVGIGGVIALPNGNYLVRSTDWNNAAATQAGAVTWGNGGTGVAGVVSSANSLVGSSTGDQIGSVTVLANGNYVISSYSWDNGAASNAGSATWGSGTGGVKGVISPANSLVGTKANDEIGGYGIVALSNGNYLVISPGWDNNLNQNAGAVTWANGANGMIGEVSAANSLVGAASNNQVGYGSATTLNNGNYVIISPLWDNGSISDVGAVTWGNGNTGIIGEVSAANSLVGTSTNDQIGGAGVPALTNGNYVVTSLYWDKGAIIDAGAVTWGNGTTGVTGTISDANSLVGSKADDQIGYGVVALSNGNYVVTSYYWDNGAIIDAGAATWGNGAIGTSGSVSASNSLVGSSASDNVSLVGAVALNNGNYVVRSYYWNNGIINDAGAITFGNGNSGVSGFINAVNSARGLSASTELQTVVVDDMNGTFYARFPAEGGGKVRVGSQFDGFAANVNLSSITPSVGTLFPEFSETVTDYTLTLPNGTPSITFIPTKSDTKASIKVNAVTVVSGDTSPPINLNDGSTMVEIEVTSQDGLTMKTYTVVVQKPGMVEFDSPVFTVTSSSTAMVADIVIRRSSGSRGMVGCKLSSGNLTAVTPAHYTDQTNVPISFADGVEVQHVQIPIAAKAATTTARTFRIVLSGTSGGASVGNQGTATVVILPPTSPSETTKPTVIIASPASNAVVNDATTRIITGTAKDNIGVRRVEVSLDSGATFTDAALSAPGEPTTGYSFTMTPVTGGNAIQVRSIDFKGNISTVLSRFFTQLRTLKVGIDGPLNSGTVTAGFAPASSRQVGKSYTITATPKAGYAFNGWIVNDLTGTGITPLAAELPALTFTFTEGLELTASFIVNPFQPALIGTFNGLVLPDETTVPSVANVGLLNMMLSNKGTFTGSLKIDGVSLSTPGFFDNTGVARFGMTARARSLILARTGKADLVIALQLDMTGSSGRITGNVTQKLLGVVQGVSNVAADRAHYSAVNKLPAPLAGTASKPYTLVFPAKEQIPAKALNTYPQGTGYATMTVKVDGTVSITGKLADNTAITASAPLSKLNHWPLFASLYMGKGCFTGLANLADADDSTEDVTGTDFLWFRPAIDKVQWYPTGWPAGITVDLHGARYVVPPATPAASVFPRLLSPTSNSTLRFSGGLGGTIIQDITISPANTVINVPAAPSPTMTIAKATGLISGIFTHSDGTKPAYQGVIVQKGSQVGGSGYFMSRATPVNGLGESGAVEVLAKPAE